MPMSFDQWLIEVDRLLISSVGLGHDDIEDWRWFDSFEDGLSPFDAFEDWELECLPSDMIHAASGFIDP